MIRVLDTHTGLFKDLNDSAPFEYAILSHTWDPEGEQTYQDVRRIQNSPLCKILGFFVWLWWHFVPALLSVCDGLRLPDVLYRAESAFYNTTDAFTYRFQLRPVRVRLLSPKLRRWSLRTHNGIAMRDPLLWPAGLSLKVRRACAVARANGHRYIWIDSCCIDKTSSAELSAAINSMYRWYRRASVCYAFLADYPTRLDGRLRRMPREYYEGRFRRSRWFSRGWTLQELIAPQVVVFLTADWEFLGTKAGLADRVEQATGIDVLVLTGQKALREVSVARRLAWAARRITSVEEDRAYSLLGIFDINMPTLYGEGPRAFLRLQEEIIKRNPDQSLFAWGPPYVEGLPLPAPDPGPDDPRRFSFSTYVVLGHARALFASAPDAFADAGAFRPIPHRELAQRLGIPEADLLPPTYVSTPYGIRTHLPVVPIARVLPASMLKEPYDTWHLAVLACETAHLPGHLVAVVCCVEQAGERGFLNMEGGNVLVHPTPAATFGAPNRIVFLSPAHIAACRGEFRVEKVYIPQEEPDFSVADAAWILIPDGWTVHLAKWSIAMLREMGYDVAGPSPGESLPASSCYVLRSPRGWVRVEFTGTVTNATGLAVSVISGRHPHPYPYPDASREDGGSESHAGAHPSTLAAERTAHRFTLQHFHEPHVVKLQEAPGHELTLRFAAICLLEPAKTGCLDVQVLRLTRQDTLAPPVAPGNTAHARALVASTQVAGDVEGQTVTLQRVGDVDRSDSD